MIDIQGNNQFALVTANMETARDRLRQNPKWGADVLTLAGEYAWRASAARLFATGPFGARVIDEQDGAFIAWGITGRKSCLAYRIRPENETTLRVEPLGYLERRWKIGLSVALACALVIPVLLSPLIWKMYREQTLRASRIYLPALCRYLEEDGQ